MALFRASASQRLLRPHQDITAVEAVEAVPPGRRPEIGFFVTARCLPAPFITA